MPPGGGVTGGAETQVPLCHTRSCCHQISSKRPCISRLLKPTPSPRHGCRGCRPRAQRVTSLALEGDGHLEPRSSTVQSPCLPSPEPCGQSSNRNVRRAPTTQRPCQLSPATHRQFLVSGPGTHGRGGASGAWLTCRGAGPRPARGSPRSASTGWLLFLWFSSSEKK